MEFAHVMNAFGTEVHLIELMDRILPIEDEEISETLRKAFLKRGIEIYTSTRATGLKKAKKSVTVTLEKKDGKIEELKVDKILVVVGRVPNTEKIGLENVGIQTEKGFIPVGDYYETKVPGIFAIGDVVNSPLLAHVASKEGEIAVEFMAGHKPPKKVDPLAIPSAVYCEPQVASFGYSEWKAKEAGVEYQVAKFPYRGAGKSVAIGKSEGFVKILFDPKIHEILGAHIIGAEATELLHEILLAKSSELLPEDIATMIHAHPTLSEAVMEAARAAEGWAIHI